MSKKYRKIVFVNSVKANSFTVIKLSMYLFTTFNINEILKVNGLNNLKYSEAPTSFRLKNYY